MREITRRANVGGQGGRHQRVGGYEHFGWVVLTDTCTQIHRQSEQIIYDKVQQKL